MEDANCGYCLKHMEGSGNGDSHVFLFQGQNLMCDVLKCKNNDGKYLIEAEEPAIGICSTMGQTKNGNPFYRNNKLIDLEKISDEQELAQADFSAYRGVKLMDPATGNTQPFLDSGKVDSPKK